MICIDCRDSKSDQVSVAALDRLNVEMHELRSA